jgi:hypothetical protein
VITLFETLADERIRWMPPPCGREGDPPPVIVNPESSVPEPTDVMVTTVPVVPPSIVVSPAPDSL